MTLETIGVIAVFVLLCSAAAIMLNTEKWRAARASRSQMKKQFGIQKTTIWSRMTSLNEKRRNLVSDMSMSTAAYAILTIVCAGVGAVAGRALFQEIPVYSYPRHPRSCGSAFVPDLPQNEARRPTNR
jgi:hypothetical protein